MVNSIEEYQNLIELLKKALEFYANADNYHGTMGNTAMIDLDEGSQARFALNKIVELEEINQNILDEYQRYVDNYLNDSETDWENINTQKVIDTIKSIRDGENDDI